MPFIVKYSTETGAIERSWWGDELGFIDKPGYLIGPAVPENFDPSMCLVQDGSVRLKTANELVSELDAARVANWQSNTIAHFNRITSEQRRPR